MIAVVVAVSAALGAATASLGFLFAFGLQAVFFWAIFLYRKQITARLVAATTGAHHDGERLPRMTVVQRGANIAAHPFSALLALPGRRPAGAAERQESALAGGAPAPSASSHTSGGPDRHDRADHAASRRRPRRTAAAPTPPARAPAPTAARTIGLHRRRRSASAAAIAGRRTRP